MRDHILGLLANPNYALLLLFAGALLIYLEFNRPGTYVPVALGTVLVLLAVYALAQLPIRPAALLLLLSAAALLALQLKFAGRRLLPGIFALLAVATFSLGTLTLIDSRNLGQTIQPAIVLPAAICFSLITMILLHIAVRARGNKSV